MFNVNLTDLLFFHFVWFQLIFLEISIILNTTLHIEKVKNLYYELAFKPFESKTQKFLPVIFSSRPHLSDIEKLRADTDTSSHANVHSQNRPHYCPVKTCSRSEGGKGFKRKNEMIRHGLVHQSPGYVCPFCPEREHKYPRPDNLQR